MIIDDPSKFPLLTADMKKCVCEAATNSVNIMAALARKEAIKNVKANFITRNTFTARQIQYTPMAQGSHELSAIKSVVGATVKAPYMARQEEGGVHRPSKGRTLAIPTNEARGGSKRNPVQSSMRVNKIGKRRRVRSPTRRDYAFWFRSEKARKVARAWTAYKKGLFIPIGGSEGQRNLFAVTEFHKTKSGVAFKLKQIYKFDKPETVTKPEPWLLPASDKAANQAQAIFNSQMKKLGL
jgi:hypothetical protein